MLRNARNTIPQKFPTQHTRTASFQNPEQAFDWFVSGVNMLSRFRKLNIFPVTHPQTKKCGPWTGIQASFEKNDKFTKIASIHDFLLQLFCEPKDWLHHNKLNLTTVSQSFAKHNFKSSFHEKLLNYACIPWTKLEYFEYILREIKVVYTFSLASAVCFELTIFLIYWKIEREKLLIQSYC